MNPLSRVPLGRTGLEVSRIGFGAAPLGDFFDRLTEEDCLATLRAAFEAGVSLVDVAPHYGNGLAEQRVAAGLRAFGRDRLILSTKVGRVMQPRRPLGAPPSPPARGFVGSLPHRPRFDYSYDGVMRAFEQSLLRLGVDRIDVLLIHDVDPWTHGAEAIEARYREALTGATPALRRLKEEGAITAFGLGLDDHEMALRFLRDEDYDVLLLAGRYSLLEQPALSELLPLAQRKGVGVILGGVFNSGVLATGARPGARYNYEPAPPQIMERVRCIEEICARWRTPLAHAALQFALAHPAVSSVVLGAVRPEEVRRNLAALAAPAPGALWRDLREAGLVAPDAPTPQDAP